MQGMGYVAIALSFALAGGIVGRVKGSSFFLWFLISGLVPVFGLLAAVFYRWDSRELRRLCPRCGHVAKLHDAKCMTCGHELEFPEHAVVSEEAMRGRAA
jgi:DNA-directed RNA polymerase subunit RPC12/RpoP